MNKVYEIITDQIIEKLEQGTIPWHMPWSADGPRNLTSDKSYRGINVFLLGSLVTAVSILFPTIGMRGRTGDEAERAIATDTE